MDANIYAAWIGFLCGCISGAVPGLFFRGENWLGGYASWPRRLIRLAHVAFFGIGFLNLSFALTARGLVLESGLSVPSVLLIVAAIGMPLVCYLSAWRPGARHLFFVPASAVMVAIVLFLWRMLRG